MQKKYQIGNKFFLKETDLGGKLPGWAISIPLGMLRSWVLMLLLTAHDHRVTASIGGGAYLMTIYCIKFNFIIAIDHK